MATPPPRLISTSSPPLANLFRLPPKPPISNQNFTAKSRSIDQFEEECRRQKQTLLSRRNAAFLSFLSLLPALSRPLPASAFSFGISGPKDWLKEQKRKASRFLLGPIYASRESLQSAYLLLNAADSIDKEKDLEEVQKLLRSAGRDCVPQDRNSFVEFQANTGVEVCTFKLIVKNASSLLDDRNPVKLEAEVMYESSGLYLINAMEPIVQSCTEVAQLQACNNSELSIVEAKLAVCLDCTYCCCHS